MLLVVVLSLLVAFLWATSTIIQKHALKDLNPATVMIVSSCFYMACLAMYGLWKKDIVYSDLKNVRASTIATVCFSAIVGGFLAQFLFIYLLQSQNSAVVTALTFTSPVFVLLMSIFLLHERSHLLSVIGIITVFVGVSLVAYGDYIVHTPKGVVA